MPLIMILKKATMFRTTNNSITNDLPHFHLITSISIKFNLIPYKTNLIQFDPQKSIPIQLDSASVLYQFIDFNPISHKLFPLLSNLQIVARYLTILWNKDYS